MPYFTQYIKYTPIQRVTFYLVCLCLSLWIALSSQLVHAKNIPYYATIKVEEANIRTGPSVKYPIRWVYKRQNWPVQVVATFETWRKISDVFGEAGWVHESLLSGNRHILITNAPIVSMYELPETNAPIIQEVEKEVIGQLLKCEKQWCQVEINDHKGWIQAKYLWGSE